MRDLGAFKPCAKRLEDVKIPRIPPARESNACDKLAIRHKNFFFFYQEEYSQRGSILRRVSWKPAVNGEWFRSFTKNRTTTYQLSPPRNFESLVREDWFFNLLKFPSYFRDPSTRIVHGTTHIFFFCK